MAGILTAVLPTACAMPSSVEVPATILLGAGVHSAGGLSGIAGALTAVLPAA
jgi:hypothetical protein